MRGTLGRRLSTNPNITIIPYSFSSSTSSSFSTFSGRGRGGGGSGDGGGGGPNKFNFTRAPGEPPHSDESNPDSSSDQGRGGGGGLGHGRGKPLPSTPFLPSFSSFVNTVTPTPSGRGGGGGGRVPATQPAADSRPQQQQQQQQEDSNSQSFGPKRPIFFSKTDGSEQPIASRQIGNVGKSKEDLPSSILSALSMTAGRGKPGVGTKPPPVQEQQVKEDNRHFRPAREPAAGPGRGGLSGRGRGPPVGPEREASPRLSRDDAVKKALSVLSRGGGGGSDEGGGRGRAVRGGGRGRGRGRGASFRGRGGRRDGRDEDEEDEDGGLYIGDEADGEKFANKVGPEVMSKMVDSFEEMSYRVLPSPEMDCFVDALDTNLAIELEPEYLMADFTTNPDIDENPPIPLRDAFEKMKPFLMAYEGIQSQEEWEEAINETMERVPLLKEIVDHYSGPDRVTAKKQQEELERVAKTLPQSAPASVQQFTSRALLSLQSNPGWGFDKKCQFMDKLVWEVSQQYK